MSKCSKAQKSHRPNDGRMTYRQVFRKVLCEVLNESRKAVDDFIEPLASVTPWLQFTDLDSPAPPGLLQWMRSQPVHVLGWAMEARIKLATGKPGGIVMGRRCRKTGRLIVDGLLAI